MRALLLRALSLPLLVLGAGACLAPPPPIVVETPFGDVHANSEAKAEEVARLLEKLAPEVQRVLPGSQDRAIDVWVQDELQVYRFNKRPESVRGFTLLSGEFSAKRIHLQEDGQSPWYLAHELVHALIGPSWAPLPGILEEGLGDVVAERLNPEYESHIRAHRLLNASAFTGGFDVSMSYRMPTEGVERRNWPSVQQTTRIQSGPPIDRETALELFSTSRADLHSRWPEIPESFYGFAWLVTSCIVERHGLEGLHELCNRARAEGLELIPAEWIFEAAGVEFDSMDTAFLTTHFGRREMLTAIYLQPTIFTDVSLDMLRPLEQRLGFRSLFYYARPAFILADGTELSLRYIGPLRDGLYRGWRRPEALE